MGDEPRAREATDLESWIGRTRVVEDTLTVDRARALAATLDGEVEAFVDGTALPHGWHWIYFHEHAPRAHLDVDGHERRGEFLPPVALERRMWAGGRLTFHGTLALGARARRTSTIRSVERKEGRAGPLVFVTVSHSVVDEHGNAVEEDQDLVYLDRAPPGSRSAVRRVEPPTEPVRSAAFTADEATLFRFSALTFNAHRIHYDHPWATAVEGYPGLVVHGPLVALLLLEFGARDADAARSELGFEYRALGPLFCNERFELAAAPAETDDEGTTTELWAAHPDRGVATRATLRTTRRG